MARMSIEDIRNLTDQQVKDMTIPELRKAVSDSSKLANERMKRLRESKYGEFSRSYQSHIRRGKTHFGVGRGKKTKTELRNELKATKAFLTQKTSTVSGTKTVRREVNKRMGFEFKNFEEEREFWRTYRLSEEKYGASYESTFNGSGDVQKRLYRVVNNPKELDNMVAEINRFHQGDRSDDAIRKLNEKGKFIDSEGKIHKISDNESLAELMKEYANKKFAEGSPKDDTRKYRGLSHSRRNRRGD